VGPLALLLDGGEDAWLAMVMLATAPIVFAAVPAWAYMMKREKTDDDRLRMIAGITSWPSLIAMGLGFVIMGVAAGWKIGGTTGAIVGAVLVAVFEVASISGQRRLHDLMQARLRGEEPAARTLNHLRNLDRIAARLDGVEGTVARLARELTQRCRQLTVEINALEKEITALVQTLAPSLLAVCGCGPLTAAKIVGETAGIDRFTSNDTYARHNGTAPLPVWSSNRARHRLSRTGNRQLNAAIHRIALTQARVRPDARAMLARRRANGDGGLEALRVLKRRLSDVVYRALRADATPHSLKPHDPELGRGASESSSVKAETDH
jgi:hypothetical protein